MNIFYLDVFFSSRMDDIQFAVYSVHELILAQEDDSFGGVVGRDSSQDPFLEHGRAFC